MKAAKTSQKDLVFLRELLEAGKVVAVIDRCYPLNETAEALRYLGAGHARGKVVITVEHADKARNLRRACFEEIKICMRTVNLPGGCHA